MILRNRYVPMLRRPCNVSKPTLTVYRPRSSKAADTTVLVCPGGGYTILALDLEGTEVCEWLNSISSPPCC